MVEESLPFSGPFHKGHPWLRGKPLNLDFFHGIFTRIGNRMIPLQLFHLKKRGWVGVFFILISVETTSPLPGS